jgi:hypothetical protein
MCLAVLQRVAKLHTMEYYSKAYAPLSSRTRGAFVVPPAFTPSNPFKMSGKSGGSPFRANGRTRLSYNVGGIPANIPPRTIDPIGSTEGISASCLLPHTSRQLSGKQILFRKAAYLSPCQFLNLDLVSEIIPKDGRESSQAWGTRSLSAPYSPSL